ncbi:class I SAM-dependent methyltransferase [Pusillimonas caeni]|uniref:class I SAM-dependent methyltransferase n=1 Tax=Pusillimonas caeni TaxID=1348472 RepID=UPI000E5A0552|nr:methyltransferase domain-containing protein [Pusillimonas caeni]TFL13324.1 class I SAM-dependent methyltransferase [Pusillimonas caeni]
MSVSSDQPLAVELAQWLTTPVGQYVQSWEQKKIDGMVANVFGYHALQIGQPQWDLLRANRIPNKGRTHSCWDDARQNDSDVALYAEPENLPLESQSIDLLILPHVLECSNSPHQVLREAERVLVPEGRVVISGFNPWSLWGAHERIPGLDPIVPVPAHMQVSLGRLKDWFKLLSFEADRGHFGCYAPPALSTKWLSRWAFMESAGDRWWPVCGAAYVVSAVKRVAGMQIIGPAWKDKKQRVRRAAVVAGRHSGAMRASGHSESKQS